MEPADYRLVRSQITAGIMIPIKRQVFPQQIDHSFSYWLYGERKSIEKIPVNLFRSNSCEICQKDSYREDFSLLNVDFHLFQHSLPLFNLDQLTNLNSLLDEDRKSYQLAIQQQYQSYRRILTIQLYKFKQNQQRFSS